MNFELNGKTYRTDAETLNVLRGIMKSAKETGDSSAVIAMLALGQKTGRIVEPITFEPGQRVICNGFPGAVIRMYSEGMVEVRLNRGSVCVSASYPSCYPA